MTMEQVYSYLEYLDSKESGTWVFKDKTYDVRVDGAFFSIKKRSGGSNGPIYPLIKGQLVQKESVQVELDIRPSYYIIVFCFIVCALLLWSILSADKITINGVYRSVNIAEKGGLGLFIIAVPSIVCYLKTIGPTRSAERWLIEKMRLKPLKTR
jgi:hypothetical protein